MVAERAEGKNSRYVVPFLLLLAAYCIWVLTLPLFPSLDGFLIFTMRPSWELAIGSTAVCKLLLHSSHFAAIRAALLLSDRGCTLVWLCAG